MRICRVVNINDISIPVVVYMCGFMMLYMGQLHVCTSNPYNNIEHRVRNLTYNSAMAVIFIQIQYYSLYSNM